MRRHQAVVCVALSLVVSACDLIGPTCVSRQKRGSVTTLTGRVAAGAIAMHRVAYGTEGSQNDIEVRWLPGTGTAPGLAVYATRVACHDFVVPASANAGDCAIVASGARQVSGFLSLIITHGRGNPEQLGNPPEYKLWIVGDDRQDVSYTVDVTWFYGPDC
jgi:hypothetical protein